MDLEEFISRREPWANSPCLYVILQDGGIKLANGSFVQNNKYRAGASGTHLYQGADLPYRSEDAINRGLNSRCNMYLNYFRTFSGKIFPPSQPRARGMGTRRSSPPANICFAQLAAARHGCLCPHAPSPSFAPRDHAQTAVAACGTDEVPVTLRYFLQLKD